MNIPALYQLYTKHFLVDTDTRNIRENTLFFALKGDNFNGNKFAEKALALGASFAIIDDIAAVFVIAIFYSTSMIYYHVILCVLFLFLPQYHDSIGL